MTDLEQYEICILCPYYFDGYCHNCTDEDCELEEIDNGSQPKE